MYLIDTNIWLELLLEQERADEVSTFFRSIPGELLNLSEFSLYSIGVILLNLNKSELLKDFVNDTLEVTSIKRIKLEILEFKTIIDAHLSYRLDFDDAYQYAACFKYGLKLVSFDKDFDKTDLKRYTPQNIINEVKL